jgi:AcrR family transcriptional regulator
MTQQPGLRERKKQRTREAITRAAHQLFVERGYQTTTLPEIAEAADVSTRTIFAYFPSKEDILFSELDEMKDALARAVAERPEAKTHSKSCASSSSPPSRPRRTSSTPNSISASRAIRPYAATYALASLSSRM